MYGTWYGTILFPVLRSNIWSVSTCNLYDNKILMITFSYFVCWLGIHRYKIINSTFGFGKGVTTQKIECEICGIQKIRILKD